MLADATPHLRCRVGLFCGLGGVVGTARDAVTSPLTSSYRYTDRANARRERTNSGSTFWINDLYRNTAANCTSYGSKLQV